MSLASSSFVSFLNDDVLAYLFHLITHTSKTVRGFWERDISALDIARHISQACCSWRQLILQSPTIWANIIDLNRLKPTSNLWTTEVLRRTGEAKLSIYGQVYIFRGQKPSSTESLMMSLLDANWHRSRSLKLWIMVGPDGVDKRFWDRFWTRPAPCLEEFMVYGYFTSDLEVNRDDGLAMFSGSAPMLRRMHFQPLRFDHAIPWLPQLVILTLEDPSTLSALNVIASCPLLESLTLSIYSSRKKNSVEDMSCHREIHLPNLQIFHLSSDANTSLFILSTIIPSTDCALSLTVDDTPTNIRHRNILQHLLKIILRYARFYSGTHRPNEIAIAITGAELVIYLNKSNETVSFRDPKFHIFFHLGNLHDPSLFDDGVINTIFSTVALANLEDVHNMQFRLFHPSWCPLTGESIHVFRSLTSVTEMTLTPSSMRALNTLSDSPSLFPSLIEVTIKLHARDQYLALKTHLPVFLALREQGGKPLRVLYLQTDLTFVEHLHDWAFLEEYDGLRCFSKDILGREKYLYGPTE